MSASIRGRRIGAGPSGENERGRYEARRVVPFFCANAHTSLLSFAHDAEVPELWDCTSCGLPAGQDEATPPPATRVTPYKTHLDYVQERRTEADGQALLEEALQRRRQALGR